MSLAYYLCKQGNSVDLFEKDNSLGGLAGSFKYQGLSIEKFYHHFYTHDFDLLSLIKEIGLEKNLVFENAPTGMYFADKLYKLSSPIDLLRFKPLSFFDRIRMGLLVFNSQRQKNFSNLENISAKDWIISKAGNKVYEVMWEPLLRNKFGKYAEDISASWLWGKFVKRGASRSKGGREQLGYLRGGLGFLFDTLESEINKYGGKIKKASPIQSLITQGGKATGILLKSGEKLTSYDMMISTLSAELTSSFLDNSNQIYKNELSKIKYLANVTLVLFLRRSLSNFYWLNVNDPESPFVGIIEHTRLADTNEYKGLSVVYIPKYLAKDDKFYSMDKENLLKHYLTFIKKISPDFDESIIADSLVLRDDFTQPIIDFGYREKIPKIETPIKNFFLVTMAQIYPEDRQISNSVRDAKTFASDFIL